MASRPSLQYRMIETEFVEFTPEELVTYRENFMKYDLDSNGQLELFELHQMFESMGETKTNAELLQLIREADQTAKGGIDYREYLTIILKDKKGLLKSSWGGFTKIVTKQHNPNTDTGKKANIFEQKAAEIASQQQQEDIVRKQAAQRRAIQKEERESAQKEKERKEKLSANLAKFKQNINK
eukprot:TRINITY_DN4876_c0_g1_i1.p1 TRINITY_DN4876_c0_g1~~TRINITY_DN4876_c0_g1_i1.p1  ORF type:complete len:198 (-),score=92.69 TRINITY_DN4876_c0_g1_i1:33-578(-)